MFAVLLLAIHGGKFGGPEISGHFQRIFVRILEALKQICHTDFDLWKCGSKLLLLCRLWWGGGRWKIEPVFSGLFPWQAREWYVPDPLRHHQIPNFLRTLHIFWQLFSGFWPVFFRAFPGFNLFFLGFVGVLRKAGKNLVRLSSTSSMADPLWQSPTLINCNRRLHNRVIRCTEVKITSFPQHFFSTNWEERLVSPQNAEKFLSNLCN